MKTLTNEEIAIARENIAKYDWAKKIVTGLKERSMGSFLGDPQATAGDLLALPDDQLWEIMPNTRIHREYYVNQHKGCPIHGIAIKQHAVFHPWKYDPINKPFKIQCPVGGEWYPSNDFANGDLTSGDFPDDGTGYKKDGDTYYFLGEYCHMIYFTAVRCGLDRLSQLYVLTGDRLYSHKAAVLLLSIAQQFPNSTDKKDRCYESPYKPLSGLVSDYIWSCGDIGGLAMAYDDIYDALDDPEIVTFASRKIPAIKTGDDIRVYIDENIVRVGAQALIDGVIVGNFGMHQRAAAILALVMDDVEGKNYPDSRDMMEWLYYKASGPARTFARNSLLKDGGGAESPSYNTSRLQMLTMVRNVDKLRARHPEAFPISRYPDLLAEPKMKAMADYFTEMILLDRYSPGIGDAGGGALKPADVPRSRKSMLDAHAETYFRRFGEDRFAQVLMAVDGSIAHKSIYEHPIDDKVREVVEHLGHFPKRSTSMLDGYGIAFARSGEEEDQRVAWIYYGGSLQHWHQDYLNLSYDAKGLALIPELGYPKSWDFRIWETHVMTHNTVMIDCKPGQTRCYGRLLALQSVPGVQLMDVLQDPYRTSDLPFGEPGRLYRRTSLLIDLSPEDSYVADIFRVKGGSEHWQSWHGAPVKSMYHGPKLTAQAKGTLAGENVEYCSPRPMPEDDPVLDPFCMFTNVECGEAAEPWSLDYDMGVRQVHTRITGLPEPGTELITADGRPPSDPNDYTIRYAFACRKGEALVSQFTTVIEPYTANRIVKNIERLEPTGHALEGFDPVGIRVTAGPIEDTILSTGITTGAAQLREIALIGDTGLVRKRDGRVETLFLSGGKSLVCGDTAINLKRAEISGKIIAVNRESKEITVSMEIGCPEALIGRHIRIHSEMRSAAYTILEAHQSGEGNVRLKLNTTSLLGEGIVSGTEDGIVKNEIMLDYAGLHMVDGKWNNMISLYIGSRLEDESGKVSIPITGVRCDGTPADTQYDVVLDTNTSPSAANLAAMLPAGTVFNLYDYGCGDEVTVLGIAVLRAADDTNYILEATDDVTLTLPAKRILMRPAGSEEWIAAVGSEIPLSLSRGKANIRIES